MKIDIQHVFSVLGLALLGWASLQVYQLNANVAVVSYKVDENHDMIKPMWQDFLVRRAKYDFIPITDVQTDFHASNTEKNK
jgi:hypothetical protein|tara:strand:- start:45 stop:287 length:243 start_codon:yes stop_codon:yes gene_type:complete